MRAVTVAAGPDWASATTAIGTVAVAAVAVGVAFFAEWRAGLRLRDERIRSNQAVARTQVCYACRRSAGSSVWAILSIGAIMCRGRSQSRVARSAIRGTRAQRALLTVILVGSRLERREDGRSCSSRVRY
jgi:hypothetical protein